MRILRIDEGDEGEVEEPAGGEDWDSEEPEVEEEPAECQPEERTGILKSLKLKKSLQMPKNDFFKVLP